MTVRCDGHVSTDDERRRDAKQVRLANEWNVRVPAGTYGPFHGSPDEAKAARIAAEDEAAYLAALLASAPDPRE